MTVHLVNHQGNVQCGITALGDQATDRVAEVTCTGCMVAALMVLHDMATVVWARMYNMTEEKKEKED